MCVVQSEMASAERDDAAVIASSGNKFDIASLWFRDNIISLTRLGLQHRSIFSLALRTAVRALATAQAPVAK